MLRLLGELASHRPAPDLDRAATHYRQADAIAREFGMRPLQARCHFALGELHVNVGKPDDARAQLAAADELFAVMGMTDWRKRVNAPGVLLKS
ncbi:MAG: hypothetical protein DMD96_04855 [Candidatus Rokuibacteriota bacterium]|nr:MAG: hypothetical protein DMD96_04855 [Candidatus Rokubacteria bacterium]